MTRKKLGKIRSCEFGHGGYQDACIGVSFDLGGDPLVLGEPCGYALHIESSVGRDYDDDEVLAAVMRANESHRDVELSALRARAERAEAELAEAHGYGSRLFLQLNPQCTVFDYMPGLMTQFDNYIAGQLQDIQAAQSTIAELTGQVERQIGALRTAVLALAHANTEMAPGLYDKAYNAVSDELARAALGGEKSTAPAFTLPPETPPPE